MRSAGSYVLIPPSPPPGSSRTRTAWTRGATEPGGAPCGCAATISPPDPEGSSPTVHREGGAVTTRSADRGRPPPSGVEVDRDLVGDRQRLAGEHVAGRDLVRLEGVVAPHPHL